MPTQLQTKETENTRSIAWVTPQVDIFENSDEILLLADFPGVPKKNLNIQLNNNELTIEGRNEEVDQKNIIGWEFNQFNFRRVFTLPGGLDQDKVSAELQNGVLHLHLPKSEAAKPRQIQVKAG